MDKDQIKKSILEKPATETCEKIIKELIKSEQGFSNLYSLFDEFSSYEEEYLRIFAALGFGYLTLLNECDLELVFAAIEKMAGDWSGKVLTYGVTSAVYMFFANQAGFLSQKFNVKDYSKDNPILYKIYLVSYSKYICKKGEKSLVNIFLSEIDKNIVTDDLDIQSGLSTAINTIGTKYTSDVVVYFEKWVALKNVNTYWILRDVLDKKFGKSITPDHKDDLIRRMNDQERERIIQIAEKFQQPESKAKVRYEETFVQTLLHHINVFNLPFNWGANPYRGCVHACDYCYGRTSHEYLGHTKEEFERVIYIKVNAAEALERNISTPKWKKQKNKLVNLGTVTDPYQSIDEKYEITRKVLEKFYYHQNPVVLTTKSDLIVRDVDILKKLGKLTNVVFSIPSFDQKFIDIIEKGAPPISRRLEAIEQLKKAGVVVGVLLIPIMPYMNDNKDDIRNIVKTLAEYKVDYVIPDILNLRGDVKHKMDYFLNNHYPSLIEPYKKLYCYGKNNDYADKKYYKDIFDFLMKDCLKQYNLNDYSKMIKGKWQ